jgi:hypothetical protein
VARRRAAETITEPPAWVRYYDADSWSDRDQWNEARFEWFKTNGFDPLDVIRGQARAKRPG